MGLSSLMIEKLLGSGEVLHLGACSFDDDLDSSLSRKPAKARGVSGTLLTFPHGNGEAKSAAQRRSLAPTRS